MAKILHVIKWSFANGITLKFSNKQKLEDSVTNSPLSKEVVNNVLQEERGYKMKIGDARRNDKQGKGDVLVYI